MTDISQENNIVPRTRRPRPERILHNADWKVSKRYVLARKIMTEFCEQRGISPDDLCVRSQSFQVVARRRKYAKICQIAGIGRSIIGCMLRMHDSTVAAYLDPGVVERKVQLKRARRVAQKPCDAGAGVAQQIP